MSSRPDAKAPTVVSLFAGLGGSSLGYHQAGFDVRLAVEWEDNACAIYKKNFPGTPVLQADVRKLSGDAALEAAGMRRGELDVLDGSPPCQGFSSSGYGDPNDERNDLFKEYLRLLRAFNPRAFVMENVRGLLHGKHRPVLRAILSGMEGAGYLVDVRVLSAAWFGIPQDRRRVIFIGARKDLGVRPEVNPPREGPRRSWSASGGAPRTRSAGSRGRRSGSGSRPSPGITSARPTRPGRFSRTRRSTRSGIAPRSARGPLRSIGKNPGT
jgi:DNA (cytosine-5)-methyltransferase 1